MPFFFFFFWSLQCVAGSAKLTGEAPSASLRPVSLQPLIVPGSALILAIMRMRGAEWYFKEKRTVEGKMKRVEGKKRRGKLWRWLVVLADLCRGGGWNTNPCFGWRHFRAVGPFFPPPLNFKPRVKLKPFFSRAHLLSFPLPSGKPCYL